MTRSIHCKHATVWLALLSHGQAASPQQVARKLPEQLGKAEAQQALAMMQRRGLVQRPARGRYVITPGCRMPVGVTLAQVIEAIPQ